MGYRSNFNISVFAKDPDESRAVIKEIVEKSGYIFDQIEDGYAYVNDVKWYECEEDCAEVARNHPDVIITVNAEGEDVEGYWEARFQGDEKESHRYELPPFKRIILPYEKNRPAKTVTYTACIIERTADGDFFPVICKQDTPEAILEEIKNHLDIESNERGITFDYDEKALMDDIITGNEHSGPFPIETEDTYSEFIVATKIFEN